MSEDKTQVSFAEEAAPWTTYILEDGTRIKVKLVMVKIWRKDGMKLPDGQQAYETQFHPIVDQSEPDRAVKPSRLIKE